MIKKRSPWPAGIVITLLIFATFIVSIAVFLSNKNFDLVSGDYYSESINYNEIMDARNALTLLEEKPSILVNDGTRQMKLNFPNSYASKVADLTLDFFKPDDAEQDFSIPIKSLASNGFEVDYSTMHKGIWNLSMRWKMEGVLYLYEDELKLD